MRGYRFPQKLYDVRVDSGRTQEAMGAILGVGKGAVGRYESGENDMDTEKLYTLCKQTGISADYLLGLKDRMTLSIEELDKDDREYIIKLRDRLMRDKEANEP